MSKKDYLSEFRALLVAKRKQLVEYRQDGKASWDGIDKSEKDYYDQANIENILSELAYLDERRWNEIIQIDIALRKLDEGAYGICESCEESIGDRRMKALPYARMCVECASSNESFGNSGGGRFVA